MVLAAKEVARTSEGKPIGVGENVSVILLDKLGTNGFSNVSVRGVPDDVLTFRTSTRVIEGTTPRPGSDEAIVGKSIRGRFKGLDLGQSFELRKNRPIRVVGVFEDGGSSHESEVWVDRQVVAEAFGASGFASSIRLKLTSPEAFDSFKASIESNRQLSLQVQRESAYQEKLSENLAWFMRIMGIVISVFFSIGAMIGAMITMHASIAHRQREIGTLRALGFGRLSILFSFLFESVMLAVVGGGVGALAALGMKLVRISTVNFASWSEIVFTFQPTVMILIGSMILAVAMGLVGGMLPAARAALMKPIDAMRD
jgi:putative ABC transport system permease protein